MENIDLSLVDWSRAQFALTAIYHWLFVPLTLGLAFILAIMETIYVKTGDLQWKKITKFWGVLFGINFAIGVATGIILEFEFGTNWSKYSWFVGDIFGAPLAIEGIMAFFMESTFIAVMFFGWNKVSKRFHLISTWLVAIGANLSALWILIANAWMQYPVGMEFNPDTARNEMINFWDVALSPMAVNKFLHTITSGFVLASIFVIGISAWYIMKKRELIFAKKSIIVAASFGLISSLMVAMTGDGSAYEVAQTQPMKLAAMEGLYDGEEGAGLIAFGLFAKGVDEETGDLEYMVKIEIPKMLSILGYRDIDAFVPGINDLVNGFSHECKKHGTRAEPSAIEKMEMGKKSIAALKLYKKAQREKDKKTMKSALADFKANFKYFGYGFLNDPNDIVPNVPLAFYSFHTMVGLGFYFILFFAVFLFLGMKDRLTSIKRSKLLMNIGIWTMPLAYIASESGWIVAEMGRQPWVIQDLMPTVAAVSKIDATAVQITFFLFAVTFTILAIAEVKIMLSQIKKGPKITDNQNLNTGGNK